MPDAATLTERQKAWFAAIREGMARETGRTLEEWIAIARTCPETKHRARLAWMKDHHGLGQNRASVILNEAFPQATGWSEPETLAATLWADPALRAILDAAKAELLALPEVVVGQRRTYTAFSRAYQFAALRPGTGKDRDTAILGLAVPPDETPGLAPPARTIWSERLKSEARLKAPADVAGLRAAMRAAWEAS